MQSDDIDLVRELIELRAPQRAATLVDRRLQYDEAEQAFGRGYEAGEVIDAGGCTAEWVLRQRDRMQPVVLYIHGGGYSLGSTRSHRHLAASIGQAADAAVLSLDYRRAPEFPFPAAVEDATAATRWLIERTDAPVILAGDSAGGGLAVASMVSLRDAGLPLPTAAVCLSPWVDLTCSADPHHRLAARDPLLSHAELKRMARAYLLDADPLSTLASPAFAELAGLPPLLIQVGTDEILLDDAHRLTSAARAQGVDVTLEEWPGMIHVWQWYFPILNEAREAIARVGTFVRSQATYRRSAAKSSERETPRTVPASLIQQAHVLIVPWTAGRGHLSWVYQLNGRLDTRALASAVDEVVLRHDILRVRFEHRSGHLLQVVTPFAPGNLALVDVARLTKREGLSVALERVNATYRSLSAEDPRLRVTLYTIGPKTSVLAMFVAEALVDGDSGSLICAELTRAYARHAGDPEPAGLPAASPNSYLDYAASHLASLAELERSHQYWARQAQSEDPSCQCRTSATEEAPSPATFAFQMAPAEWRDVSSRARALQSTPYVLTLASLQLALARLRQVKRLLVHSIVACRGRGQETMIGNFHSLVRIALRLTPSATLADLVPHTADAVANAIDHCIVPAPLSAQGTLLRLASGDPLPDVRFYMFASREGPLFAGVRRRRFRLHEAPPALLTMSCIYGPGGRQDFIFSSTAAPVAQLERLGNAVRGILARV